MKISVIIPCYNGDQYLAQSIGSALDQSREPHEIIVVDDGSTDASLAVAERFAAENGSCVRVLSERSGQAARTRNLGAAAASGDALLFLDADDVIAPRTLESLAEALVRQPDSIAVCPWYRLAVVDGKWVELPRSCAARRPGDDALSAWLTGWYHPPCSVLWSREAFERTGRWDERWNPNDDGDLMMRAMVFGISLVEARPGPGVAGYYRRLPEEAVSLSGARFTREGIHARLRTVQKIAYLLEKRGRIRFYRRQIREAFLNIASAAKERHPDLCDQAESYAGQYEAAGPARSMERALTSPESPGRRLYRAFRSRAGRAVSALNSTPAESSRISTPVEVRHGLDRAEAVMASATNDRDDAPSERLVRRENPAVSVVIPTYNRAHVLGRALKSVLAQTFDDFEVLVVDDGSTDDTEDLVTAFGDSRIRYLAQSENRGVGAARNRGLREARGEFVAFLDSDDEWHPKKLDRQIAVFRDRPEEIGLVYTGVESVFGDGSRRVDLPTRRGNVYEKLLLENVIHGGGSNAMIRRNVIATVGFFDEAFPAIEDYDYWLRISRFFEIDFVDEPLIRYHDSREHEPGTLERKSLDVGNNLAARALLYRKHRSEMLRAGVAHHFLLESARRHLVPEYDDSWGARLLTIRAVLEAPKSRTAHKRLRRIILPPRVRQILVTGWRSVRPSDSI